jgi:2-dehydropantoate 2-reductase
MRILVVGAGAIGGYFGARLAHAGRDVTFLVRDRRAREIAEHGLPVRSRFGDLRIEKPRLVKATEINEPFDLILLSCKAYDLDDAIASFAPAVGETTAILPLLNGMRHMDVLDARFGPERVLGGLCIISSTLGPDGAILHLNEFHLLSFGERGAADTPRIKAIGALLAGANFEAQPSFTIMRDMWEKWMFIASAAGITCLMRAAVGDIVAAGGADLAMALIDECAGIAAANGHTPTEASVQRSRAVLSAAGSPLTASMLRDIERGARTEGDHILGDLLSRAKSDGRGGLLRIAYAHLKAYEISRARIAGGAS